MKISCPACDSVSGLELTKELKTIEIRKEPITFTAEHYLCNKCGEKSRVLQSESESDPLILAYRAYRDKHGMLHPQEIRDFRQQFNITQGELAALLGLGGATLSRYERGQLQDKTHDTLIRMAMDPEQLRELVYSSEDVFMPNKKNRVLRKIDEATHSQTGLMNRVITVTSQRKPDEYSGFRKFDKDRFLNAVLYFCKEGVFKTKLNKLLYYSDFRHYKEYTVSITGAAYAHVPFGPAPQGYELYFPMLVREGKIGIEEVFYQGKDCTGEKYWATEKPDLNVFSETELEVLTYVKKYFKSFNAGNISEFSHKEKGYQDTETGKLISYRYAEELKI